MNSYLTKEDIQLASRQLERCTASYEIRKFQIKMRMPPLTCENGQNPKPTIPNAANDIEHQKLSLMAAGNEMMQLGWKTLWWILPKLNTLLTM